MPFQTIGAYACQNLQTDLVDYYKANSPQYRTLGSTSLIKWLLSPQNTANFRRINVTSIPGKKRAVAFQITDPFCFDLARAARACATPAGTISQTPQEIIFDLDVDPYRIVDGNDAPVALKIDLDQMMQYCTINDMSWITDQISRTLFRFEEVLDLRLLELLVTQVGQNLDGDAVTNIPLWVVNTLTNTAVINPEAEFAMTQVMKDIGVDSQFGIVGGKTVSKLQQYLKWLVADLASVDMSKTLAATPFAFYDRNANSVMTENDWLQLPPGAVQLVTWNRYAPGSSVRKEVTDLYTKGTVALPTSGLMVDYNWIFDYQCNIWTFEPLLYADLAVVPPGGCGTPNVNGILRFHDCSGRAVIPDCPAS